MKERGADTAPTVRECRLSFPIAIQHRMAYQGEHFIERYGKARAEQSPPIKRMLAAGVPVGAGTDATQCNLF